MRSKSRERCVKTLLLALIAILSTPLFAADDLKLNPNLDYNSDSFDGPLITGMNLEAGPAAGRPNYVIIYGERCYNSKRQARRTVSLYGKYKGRVGFVIISLDRKHSPEQQQLVQRYYQGYIPHVVVLDRSGKPLYDNAGEVGEEQIAELLDKALR